MGSVRAALWTVVKLPPARRSGSVAGSNGGLCLRRLGREVAAGGVKRPFAHWRAVAAPDVKPGPNHFVASVTDGAGFPRPRCVPSMLGSWEVKVFYPT